MNKLYLSLICQKNVMLLLCVIKLILICTNLYKSYSLNTRVSFHTVIKNAIAALKVFFKAYSYKNAIFLLLFLFYYKSDLCYNILKKKLF